MKLGPTGLQEWSWMYGGLFEEYGTSVIQGKNGYIVSAVTNTFGNGQSDIWLLKIDENGNPLRQKTFGGTDAESASILQKGSEQTLVILGNTTRIDSGQHDLLVLQTDSNGNITSSFLLLSKPCDS